MHLRVTHAGHGEGHSVGTPNSRSHARVAHHNAAAKTAYDGINIRPPKYPTRMIRLHLCVSHRRRWPGTWTDTGTECAVPMRQDLWNLINLWLPTALWSLRSRESGARGLGSRGGYNLGSFSTRPAGALLCGDYSQKWVTQLRTGQSCIARQTNGRRGHDTFFETTLKSQKYREL